MNTSCANRFTACTAKPVELEKQVEQMLVKTQVGLFTPDTPSQPRAAPERLNVLTAFTSHGLAQTCI